MRQTCVDGELKDINVRRDSFSQRQGIMDASQIVRIGPDGNEDSFVLHGHCLPQGGHINMCAMP
jgi:hypothetical protein